jgi:hypothetical protein
MKRFTRVSRARIGGAPIVDRARIQATAARFDSKPIPWAFLWLWRGVRTAARPVRRRTRERSDAPSARRLFGEGIARPRGRVGSHPHHRLDPVDVSVGSPQRQLDRVVERLLAKFARTAASSRSRSAPMAMAGARYWGSTSVPPRPRRFGPASSTSLHATACAASSC